MVGKDASKLFDSVGHSDHAKEMAKLFLVGEYQEVHVDCLQVGLACFMPLLCCSALAIKAMSSWRSAQFLLTQSGHWPCSRG